MFSTHLSIDRSFPGGAVVQNLPATEGDARDVGLIPGWGRSSGIPVFFPGKFHGQRSLVGLQSMGSEGVGHN